MPELQDLAAVPEDVKNELLRLELRLAQITARDQATSSFLSFCRYVWPEMIVGAHHKKIAAAMDRIVSGECKRLMIAMPPRHGKSQMGSYLFPAYLMGKKPDSKLIVGSHTAELAQRFGRMIRNLVADERYKELFPDFLLSADSKAAGRWDTSHGGEAFFIGKGGAMTGRGGNVVILDDILDEQDALSNTAMENTWEWYQSGPRQRLQPNGAIIVINTRWKTDDLSGRLLKLQGAIKSDKWEILEFPAILPSGGPLWPEYWKLEELEAVKHTIGLQKWNAQWQQTPTSSDSAIIKREWWQSWEKKEIPPVKYIIQSYDTAFSKKESADYSAITTWGVFEPEEGGSDNLILLDARRGRWNFPELKEVAYEEHEYWEPDMVVVEAKATGTPLIDELRLRGIPALGFSPGKGRDKVTRMHMVAPLFEAGVVWAPNDKKFADEVIEEVVSFPNGDHDDFCDSMTLALMRFRQGGFVSLLGEEEEHDEYRRKREYY